MSTKDLINAIVVGDALEIETAFNATMAEKISDRLDIMRQDVAQSMFAKESVDLDEAVSKLTHIRVDPTNKTAKDKLGKIGSFGHDVDLSDDTNYKKAMGDAHEYGKKQFGGEYTVTHMGPGHTAIRASSVDKVRKSMQESVELDEVTSDDKSSIALRATVTKLQSKVNAAKNLTKEETEIDEGILDQVRGKMGSTVTGKRPTDKSPNFDGKTGKALHPTSNLAGMRSKMMKKEEVQLEDFTLEELEEFMMSEEFEQLDELSKQTLGSYVKKASSQATGLATTAMHHQNYSKEWDKVSAERKATGDKKGAKEAGKKADEFAKHSFDATEKQVKRMKGVNAAVNKLTKEDVEQLVVTTVESALYAMQDGRSVLDEQLDEAVSQSSKDNYEWTHSSKPKGHGNWFFSTVHPRQHDFDKHKDQTVNVTGTFGDAAKKAQAHFKEKGHKGEIHVLT